MDAGIIDKALDALQNARGLPALERNVTSLLQSISAGQAAGEAIIGHVVEDVALTQKVLKLANSPMYAPFAQEADTVSSALSVLGEDGLMHIALGAQVLSDAQMAEDASLSQTLFASELARSACPDQGEAASVAALMYDLGRLVLTRYLPEESERIDQEMVNGGDYDAASRKVLGISLQDFGTGIARRWNLPAGIVSIIDGSGDPQLVGVARFSTAVSSLIHEGKAEAAAELVSKAELPGLDKGRLASLVQRKKECVPVRKHAPLPPKVVPPSSAGRLDELLLSLRDERKKTVDELAGMLIPPLSQTLNMAHCLLFMAVKTGEFYIRYGFGKGVDELHGKLRISAEFKPTAFHAAIKNNVDVSITDVRKLKPTSLPDGYHQLLPTVTRFLILPIASKGVTGLLYCDWEDPRELQPDEVVAVRKLRDLFLPYFPR